MFRSFKICHALREKFSLGYSRSDLMADLMSGLIVACVAIPLGMALAIASGVSPERGLYTIITAGFFVALLGGSRFQVTGPTAAFVVLLLPILHHHGLAGLLTAGMLAGIILILMGIFRLGRFIEFIPHPVVTGFTAGIALVIATIQFKDFFGLRISQVPEDFTARLTAFYSSLSSYSPWELGIGLLTLAILLFWPRLNRKIPAPLIALSSLSLFVFFLKKNNPDLSIATIQSMFHPLIDGHVINGIPASLPRFQWPWQNAEAGTFILSTENILSLLPASFSIALLGAVESLLSAVVADSMTSTRHEPNSELFALGVGNLIAPCFGGIAATGAIARTATNIRFGARSPISAILHSIFVLLSILFFAPAIGYLPMASLAALLILVAYNMSDMKNFIKIIKTHPKTDIAILLVCFIFTVIYNMVVGVGAGIALAFILARVRRVSRRKL
ncbi:MAG: C4-dicarboxylic acid transporter DauA [Deltaproteobacteria bacterium]|nr:C4-dicarboxylic acid transporter DauA [Deltaproteobacteria bacterium]